MNTQLAGVVLAAGEGARLRPLTTLRPKALCPVDDRPLVDWALDRVGALTGTGPARLAVNAHHLADQLVAHCTGRAHVSLEQPVALGTAGALGALREWLNGRDVVLSNADAYLPEGLGTLLEGWDGERSRLLCRPVEGRGDFVAADGRPLRYVGGCVLAWRQIRALRPTPSGLYETLWREAAARGRLDLVTLAQAGLGDVAIDCGTPAEYLAANLHAGGGLSVVGAGAVVEGTIERSVIWDGAYVGPGERLSGVIRAGTREHPLTLGQ